MSIEVEVRGFQSIENVTLVLDGFTALVGRSNIGKSAFVRAMKTALTNATGSDFVRHNPSECARSLRKIKTCKCQASVHIRAEGFDLYWEKGDATNKYRFNGKEYDKPGVGIPEFLVKSGFDTVTIGSDTGLIQVADQFFPIFLLNQSGPAIAEAISDVARLDRVNAATRSVERDRREAVATRKVRQADVQSTQEKLKVYEGLDETLRKTDDVFSLVKEVESKETTIQELSNYVGQTDTLVSRIKSLWQVGTLPIPELEGLQEAEQRASTLRQFVTDLARRAREFKSLQWVENFQVKEDFGPLIKMGLGVQELSSWVHRLRTFRGKFEVLVPVEGVRVEPFTPLSEGHSRVKDGTSFIRRYQTLTGTISKLEAEILSLEKELQAVQIEVDELGVCPTCTQPVSAPHYAHA